MTSTPPHPDLTMSSNAAGPSPDPSVAQPPLARHDSSLLDLAVAMDTTGSMGSYIRVARDSVRRLVEEIVAREVSTCV